MPGRRTLAMVLSPEGVALTVPATLSCTSSCYNVGGRIRPKAEINRLDKRTLKRLGHCQARVGRRECDASRVRVRRAVTLPVHSLSYHQDFLISAFPTLQKIAFQMHASFVRAFVGKGNHHTSAVRGVSTTGSLARFHASMPPRYQ
jgi:hypothetical protein